MQTPEIAFTSDTTADFLLNENPVVADALKARLLIIEMTFIDDSVTVDEVRGCKCSESAPAHCIDR